MTDSFLLGTRADQPNLPRLSLTPLEAPTAQPSKPRLFTRASNPEMQSERAWVAYATAAPARSAAATIAASTSSALLTPALRALPACISMQYGHWVVRATATAISSLYFRGIAPSPTAALSNAQKAFITSGARLSIFFSLPRLVLLYMDWSRLSYFCARLSQTLRLAVNEIIHDDDIAGGRFQNPIARGNSDHENVSSVKFNSQERQASARRRPRQYVLA